MSFNRFEYENYKLIASRRGLRDWQAVPDLKIRDLYKRAQELIVEISAEFNVPPVPLFINISSRRSLGRYLRVTFGRKVTNWIELSHYFTLANPEEVEDTVKHEMAHYICWLTHKEDGHGFHWVLLCRQIGCSENRFFTGKAVSNEKESHLPEHLRGRGYKWVYKCSCGKEYYRTRRFTDGQAYCRLCTACQSRLSTMKLERIG